MYRLLRGRSLKAISVDAVPLGTALAIAELFFKWHSFTLECAGFLATWFVLDWLWYKLALRLPARGSAAPSQER